MKFGKLENMKAALLILVTFLTFVVDGQQRVNYSGHEVISVRPQNKEDVKFLWSLQKDKKVDLWNHPGMLERPVMMRLSPEVKQEVRHQLTKRNMEIKIHFEDVQKIIDEEQQSRFQPLSIDQGETTYNFSKYHSLHEIYHFVEYLTNTHPEISKLESIGTSYQNRSIYSVKIGGVKEEEGSTEEKKPIVILEFGIHAREWAVHAVATYLLNQILTTYGKDKEVTKLVDKFEFIIIPTANPDGYVYSHDVERYWRKTVSKQASNCLGVDGNRNFDFDFGRESVSDDPCDECYPGTKPFTEPETRALRDLMLKHKDRIAAYFAIHSFMQAWMFPPGYKAGKSPNHDELNRVAEIGVKALEKKYGTKYQFGTSYDVSYAASGTAADYAYAEVGIPIVFEIEVRDEGEYGFHLPEVQLLPTCEETYDGIMAAIDALNV